MKQPQFVFHQDEKNCNDSRKPKPPTLEDCLWQINPDNHRCLFNNYVGQESAKKKMGRVLVSALQKYNHEASEVSWLLTGPSSVGKTTLAKLFAKILRLPFIEINPTSISKLDEIFALINDTLDRSGLRLVDTNGFGHYRLPPCVIFFDEAHALKKNIQNGLLKAIESADRTLITESKLTISTAKATFMMATTDLGDLSHALTNRFSEVALKPYTRKEIAQIVKLKFPDWDLFPCAIAAYFEPRIPRKAIEFAQEMNYEKKNNPNHDWLEVGITIANENDIDELGMPLKHIKILHALSKKPISKDQLANILNIRAKELTEFIIPWLIVDTHDCPALVSVSTRGFKLTSAGYNELKKRNMVDVPPKYLEDDENELSDICQVISQPVHVLPAPKEQKDPLDVDILQDANLDQAPVVRVERIETHVIHADPKDKQLEKELKQQ